MYFNQKRYENLISIFLLIIEKLKKLKKSKKIGMNM